MNDDWKTIYRETSPTEFRRLLVERDRRIADLEHQLRQEREASEKEERAHIQTIAERDHWEEKATELAGDIGEALGFDVGEHSSANCPVQNAIDGVFEMRSTLSAALAAKGE